MIYNCTYCGSDVDDDDIIHKSDETGRYEVCPFCGTADSLEEPEITEEEEE